MQEKLSFVGPKSHINRLFPSSPGPLYQNEVKFSAFDMEMSFHSQPHFGSEGFWNSEVAYS